MLFEQCNRFCEGCCNKDWDFNVVPVCTDFTGFDMVMLTGGEPMLNPPLIVSVCESIREQTNAEIILYTAKPKRSLDLVAMLNWVDGITLTLHEQYDVRAFNAFNSYVQMLPNVTSKQLHLNIFENVDASKVNINGWQVKHGMQWIKNCPLPEDEILMRLWD